VGGKALDASAFTVTGNTVMLGTAAASGATVTVTYAIANSGTGGNDTMLASTVIVGAPMVLIGGSGNDTLIGGSKSDSLIGDDGEVVLNAAQGVIAVESLGGSGNDVLIGNGGNDRMIGGSGNDTLTASTGKDVLIGDYGRDNPAPARTPSPVSRATTSSSPVVAAIRSRPRVTAPW
jgi:Ca2+-binding RTX toxin-like protein